MGNAVTPGYTPKASGTGARAGDGGADGRAHQAAMVDLAQRVATLEVRVHPDGEPAVRLLAEDMRRLAGVLESSEESPARR